MVFSRLFRESPLSDTAANLYAAIVAQARQPWFYETADVPDTVDGRFEMIVLHAFLLFRRLRDEGEEAAALSQRTFDVMFKELDRALREMGAGDMSVGKKVKKMAAAFYGRAQAYEDALSANDSTMLQAAFVRNIYPEDAPDPVALGALSGYVEKNAANLRAQPLKTLLRGELNFVAPGTGDRETGR